ncbi:MAG: DUF4381 domain-containing protein [Hydrogenovibrio sp.]
MEPKIESLLTQLNDIALPEPVGWWPLSQTLIGLFVGIGGLIIGLSWYFYTQKRNNRYRNEALALFEQALHPAQSPQQRLHLANKLLKQVAITNYGRRDVAKLNGQAWVNFLHRTALYIDQPENLQACLEAAYRPNPDLSDHDIQATLDYARHWIKGHHK